MATPGSDDVDGYTRIEQERFVSAAEIMEPKPWETKLSRLSDKFLGQTAGIARPGEVGLDADRRREDQRAFRQLDERQVDGDTV